MRGYICLSFFCAVLTFVSPAAPSAAENAAEYRAPVTSAKLGPVPPGQPAQSGAAGAAGPAAGALPGQAQNGSPQPQATGQPSGPDQPGQAAPGQNASGQNGLGQYAPGQAVPGQPTPWPASSPSGAMMPYSALGGLPPSSEPSSSTAAAPAANPATNPVANPAASVPVNPSAGFAPPPLPPAGYVPGYAPPPLPPAGYVPGYAPPPGYVPGPYPPAAAFDGQGQGGDVVYGTGQLQGNNFDDRGSVSQYRDPLTGDIVTSVVPPSQQEQPDYGTIFVAPQIYPNGRPWGPGPYGPMPRPGQPYVSPSVTWQPGMPADKHRHRHDDRRPEGRGYDDGYGRRSSDRYDARPDPQGYAPYDQRDADRSRDGRERR